MARISFTFSICLVVFLATGHSAPASSSSNNGDPVVQTMYGKVQGMTQQLEDNSFVDEFRGIPYAKPPVGPLRFKKPEPPLSWTGIKNVMSDNSRCIQHNVPSPGESEDCLYLDVYRPHGTNSSNSLPVMVFIHGGGFKGGSKAKFNGTIMAAHGVVLVHINYRLGPLGFMSTEDSVMPGNYGMMDQVLSLKWVQSNIAAFGGDPDSVTIFGSSAGSMSVSFLILSPLAKGLFTRGIMASGTSTTTVAMPPPSVAKSAKNITLAIGSKLGCSQNPGAELLLCLQKLDAQVLYNTSVDVARSSGKFRFRSRVETDFGFMPDYPLNLISRGEVNAVDTLRGFTSHERGKSVKDPQNDGLTIQEFRDFATKQLVSNFKYLNPQNYLEHIESVYIANITDPFKLRDKAIELATELYTSAPTVLEAIKSRQKIPGKRHYLYQFNYQPSFTKTPDWQGIVHGTDFKFDFGLPWEMSGKDKHPNLTPIDEQVAETMVTMWTNFAKYGNPTPAGKIQKPLIKWNQFFVGKPNYLFIDSDLTLRYYNTTDDINMLNLYRENQMEYRKTLTHDTAIIG